MLALAELAGRRGNSAESISLLEQAFELRPDLMDPRVRLGQAFLDLGRPEELFEWLTHVRASADRHPGIWNLRGRWAEDLRQVPAPARCYWEALRIDPGDTLACYRLGATLRELGREAEGQKLLDRSRLQQ